MKQSSIKKAASPSRPDSKFSEERSLAALLQEEVTQRGTRWDPCWLTYPQIREHRARAKLPSGKRSVYKWLEQMVKQGKLERKVGTTTGRNGKLIRDVRYRVL